MRIFTLTVFAFATFAATQLSLASETNPVSSSATHSFVKKKYSIKGGWNIGTIDGQTVINFDEGFRTKSGPDLKVYLSKSKLSELTNDKVESSSTKLSVLKANKGQQSYIIPAEIDLNEFQSVVIHCEAFSVLWGGFDIASNQTTP